MVQNAKNQGEELKNGAKDLAEAAKDNPWIDRITRLGYFTRGLLYGLIGYLAVQVIFTGQGEITGREGVLATIAAQPFGKIILIVVAVGLLGMLLWGIIRAVADPYRKGHDAKGVLTRAGYLIAGLSYGVLLFPTLRLITGAGKEGGGQQPEQVAAGVMNQPWGPWLVGAVGVAIAVVGAIQIYQGIKAKFEEQFKAYDMTPDQHKWALRMGRIGRIARGTVYILIGFLAVLAAVSLDPQRVGGIDSALTFLLSQPYGPWLLAAVALGLIAFAIYSFMGALWFRIKEL